MKLLKKMFDARSPFWQLMLALVFVGWFSYAAEVGKISKQLTETGGFELTTAGPLSLVYALLTSVLFIAAYVTVARHNKKHPSSKLSVWQFYPPELLNGDEMFETASRNAARRVYLYNNYALPVLVLATLFYRMYPLGLGLLFAVYLSGYYLTYLWAVWPYLGED